MSFQTLSERLSVLQESSAQLKDLIDRLTNLKFQPGSIPLNDEDGNVMTELTLEIQQTLKDQEEDFELLLEEVYELDDGRLDTEMEGQRSGLEEAVTRAARMLKSYEAAFRKAQLSARHNLQAAQRQERELLLQSYIEPRSSTASPLPDQHKQQQRTQKNKVLTQGEKELNASSHFTLALRRTQESMAAELSRSQFAHDTLKESTAALETLSETYSTLDTMLSRSKNLLGTLMTSQKTDTWYLETAFMILSVTIAWLIWRRILYGPAWWLVWFPVKIFIKGWMGVFATLRANVGNGAEIGSVASVAAATSLAANSVLHRKATRGPKISGMKPPSVTVGGGGRGAPMKGPNVPGAARQPEEEMVSERVGRIIDESKDKKLVLEEPTEDVSDHQEPVNPKKRIWDEEAVPTGEEAGLKDEL